MGFEWYTDFVDLSYKPEDEIVCYFKVKSDLPIEESSGRVASESSVGTWTTLSRLPDRIKWLMAKVFRIDGERIAVAYKTDLFEEGNIPQFLSSVAGNIFGMRAIKGLRFEDFEVPASFAKHFKGPNFGIDGVRNIMRVHDRPLTATVPKPKVGFDADEYAEVGYRSWVGGIDILKDDENLTSQPFIRFEKRLAKVMKARERAENETGEKKGYLINITAEAREMERRAELVADYGNEFVMVDILTAGFSAVQTVRNKCEELGLAIHAHRAMHGAFTRNEEHGISLKVLTKLARMAGVDHMHVGTGVGKMAGDKAEVMELRDVCRKSWHNFKPVFPVSSGGLHPGLIPDIIELFGVDVIIQAGGGVHGHPDGSEKGAMALRQAISAVLEGVDLEDYAKSHSELARALERWGRVSPK
ncbi:ribulose 1,5-bisphosphate carboxylase large subunit [Archaeoglobus sulfaticallidus PM70-1]|uniref:Ribulose bisphosphate carboxylase n=1 Tax=Archaeoglobus sulfaticallidus PM70-1 TaxID=387631 RepID=N0BMV6_9EURY|nr:type III ribulose-bisphosphate carboxylase [Archaeoglobus sulfaticallidus]AGK61946.1 ribulose 1,5-bisphosphate carboxylase large subunit [Archaeoglobus sulfaticallidus PM70-1]